MDALMNMNIHTLLIVGNVILAVVVFVTMYLLTKYIMQNNVLNRMNQWIKATEENRTIAEERLRLEDGNQEKDTLFYKIDLMLNQSGIKKKMTFMSTEYLMLFSVIASVVGFMLVGFMTSWSYGIIMAIVMLGMPFIAIRLLADLNHNKIEKQIIHFLNMIENYSHTQDNLVTIFGKVYPFLAEPLSSAVKECYMEAYNTGNVSLAFRRLESKVVHEKLSEILQNLELCGMHEANYQVIISEAREIMTRYVNSKENAKTIVNRAKYEFITLVIILLLMINIMSSIMEINIMSFALGSGIGMLILIYIAAVLLYGIFSIISITKL